MNAIITVIIDQGFAPSAYELKAKPLTWAAFMAKVDQGAYSTKHSHPRVAYVEHQDVVGFGEVAFRPDDNGYVSIWLARYDSL